MLIKYLFYIQKIHDPICREGADVCTARKGQHTALNAGNPNVVTVNLFFDIKWLGKSLTNTIFQMHYSGNTRKIKEDAFLGDDRPFPQLTNLFRHPIKANTIEFLTDNIMPFNRFFPHGTRNSYLLNDVIYFHIAVLKLKFSNSSATLDRIYKINKIKATLFYPDYPVNLVKSFSSGELLRNS